MEQRCAGPKKYELGDTLLRRLRDRFAPGGFLHHGQGKWYPGESLPRWAFGLYWRKDGQPIWVDPELVADEKHPNHPTDDDAQFFTKLLAEKLGVPTRYIAPGYEDVWYYLWKERRLPVNVDPFDNKLASPEARARLAKVFEQGLDKVVGYVMPLRRIHYTDGTAAWATGPWFFRPERMYLVPGDSPMGFRLPLESIPWVSKSDYPYDYERDPWEPRGELAARARQRSVPGALEPRNPLGYVEQSLYPIGNVGRGAPDGGFDPADGDADFGAAGPRGRRGPAAELEPLGPHGRRGDSSPRARASDLPPARGESAADLIRTALCAEVRGGVLRIFMPPQRYIEDYLDLVAAIEETSAELKLPVLVEGYPPPFDPRIHQIKVTPDPGVIEVNTRPVETWDELVKNTTALYEEARLTRLGTEKFMLDGRHTGTGGGNHIVVGGATP